MLWTYDVSLSIWKIGSRSEILAPGFKIGRNYLKRRVSQNIVEFRRYFNGVPKKI